MENKNGCTTQLSWIIIGYRMNIYRWRKRRNR